MANVSANINTTSISVTNTPSNITVTDTDSGSNVNVTIANNTITVGATQTNVLVSAGSILSNAVVRNAISVTDTGGDGSLSYNSTSGVITYTGPSQAEVLAHFSNVSPINLEANGQISVDESAIFSGKTTDDLTEGSTNLYYTNARVLAYITDNGLDFNAEKVDDRVANLLQTTGNLTFTYDDGANTLTLSQSLTTDDISEGVNQYYTTAKANSAIVTYLGDSGNAPFTIAGNLDISGNLNYENVTDLYVTDQKITLNANATTDATVEIIANRPQAGANTVLRWNETDDKWQFTNDGSTYYPIPTNSDDLAEGSTNLYFTNAKVLTAITEGNVKFQEVAETVITANTTITGYFGNANTGNVDQIVFETDPGLATSDSVTLLGTTNGNLNFLNGNTYQVYRNNATTYDLYEAYPGTPVQSGLGSESPSGLYVKYQAFGNITIDVDQGTLHNVEAVGNITGITFDNIQEGTSGTIILHQDSVGYRLLDTTTYAGNWSTWEFINDFKTLTPNANSIDLINFVYDGANVIASIENVDQLNIETTANISTTGNLQVNPDTLVGGLKGFTFDASTNRLGLGTTTPEAALHIESDNDFDSQIYMKEARTTASGNDMRFYKARGTLGSPTAVASGDRIAERLIYGHDGTDYGFHMRESFFVDSTIPVSTGVMQIGWELKGDLNGTGGTDSLLKLRGNGALQIGEMDGSGGSDDGNAGVNFEVQNSGDVYSYGGNIISSTGTIQGSSLTDGQLSINSGAITNATSGTFSGQVQAGTFTDGSFSVTGGNFSTVGNIDATGYYQTNGLIKTFGGNIETTTGNIITLANINAGGGTLTGNLVSDSNITGGYIIAGNDSGGDGFFIGDINGAVQQEVKNNTGAQLDRGKAVYLTGTATGATPHVALADNSNASLMPVIGIVKNNIPDTENGEIVTSGEVNIGTHGFAQGSDLFVNGTGDLQVTAPTGEGNLVQKIGKVVSSTHIIVQGAFRTNATPNLNENNIFIGNATNQATTVALDNLTANIKTTGNLQVNPDTAVAGLKGLTFDSATNRLGLGTTSPTAGLEIVSSADTDAQIYLTEYDDGSSGPDIRFRRAEGTEASPTTMNDGDHVGQIFFTPWRQNADSTGNASHATTFGGDWGIGMEIATFAEGDQNLVYSMPVATLEDQGAGNADRLQFTDTSIRYNDGIVIAIDNTTNANLTVLNGNAFYADNVRIGGQNYYDLYYDEARTLPVEVAVGTETATDMTGNIVAVVNPVGLEIIAQEQQNDRFSLRNIHKIRSNGDIEIGCTNVDTAGTPTANINTDGVFTTTGNITTTANISAGNVLGIVKGEVDTTSNITTTANVSGNYLLGNASQVTGVNLFETISVSGQTDVVADSISDTLTLAAGTGMTITTDAANDTITFESTGGGGSYGNSDVANFLDSDTMTANIEYTGNLLVGAPAANANIAASNFFGNVANAPDDVDQVQFASAPGWSNGTAVTFNSTTNSNLLFLNGTTYYVQSRSADTFALYTNVGLTTPSQSGLGVESVSGLQGEYVSAGVSQANIEGPIGVTDMFASNASFADVLKPYTSGGTIGFVSPRMSDVGLGGSAGDDFFWPETGRPAQGSLLIAGVNGSGYWSQGLVLENDSIDLPVASNVSSSRATIPGGIQDIYRRSRGNTSSPTAVQLNSGSTPDIISSTKFLGHDGTNYQSSFFSNVYVDGAVSTGVVPLAMEISTWENGDSSKTNSGFGFPIVKFKSDRTIEFNSPNPLTYNNPQGNANITADGSINSNANITTVANINAAGATFTGTVTSNSLISTTANVQINSETQVDGIKGLTYDTVNNYLGLGTPIPEAPLHVLSDSNGFSACVMIREFSTGTSSSDLRFQRAEGSLSSPDTMNSNDRIGQIRFDPLRSSIPGNVTTYDFNTSPTEITAFADGTHGATTNLAVASYTIQSGSVGDEFQFADRTVSFNDGDGVLFNGATNANLTPLNGNVFYVDRGGGASARVYDIYYDQALTNPVRLTGDTSDVTGLTAELRNVYQPVGLQISTIDTNSDGTLNITNHKFRADGNVEFGCTDQRTAGTGNVIITPEGSITVGDRLRLKNYTSTEILALTGNTAGDVVYNSTDNLVAYYDGTNWRNIAQGAIIT